MASLASSGFSMSNVSVSYTHIIILFQLVTSLSRRLFVGSILVGARGVIMISQQHIALYVVQVFFGFDVIISRCLLAN